jgi:hypothetical protein
MAAFNFLNRKAVTKIPERVHVRPDDLPLSNYQSVAYQYLLHALLRGGGLDDMLLRGGGVDQLLLRLLFSLPRV